MKEARGFTAGCFPEAKGFPPKYRAWKLQGKIRVQEGRWFVRMEGGGGLERAYCRASSGEASTTGSRGRQMR